MQSLNELLSNTRSLTLPQLDALQLLAQHFVQLCQPPAGPPGPSNASRKKRRRCSTEQSQDSQHESSSARSDSPGQTFSDSQSDSSRTDSQPPQRRDTSPSPSSQHRDTPPQEGPGPSQTPPQGDPEPGQTPQQGDEGPAAKKRRKIGKRSDNGSNGTKAIAKSSPWIRFLRLKSVELGETGKQYLEKHGTQPEAFFIESDGLTNETTGFTGKENMGDAFVAHYRWIVRLEGRLAKDNLRLAFTWIMFYDVVKLIRPNGRGRIGEIMLPDIQELIDPLDLGVSPEKVLTQLRSWSNCGKKLNVICEEFGLGSLFYLAPYLSEDL